MVRCHCGVGGGGWDGWWGRRKEEDRGSLSKLASDRLCQIIIGACYPAAASHQPAISAPSLRQLAPPTELCPLAKVLVPQCASTRSQELLLRTSRELLRHAPWDLSQRRCCPVADQPAPSSLHCCDGGSICKRQLGVLSPATVVAASQLRQSKSRILAEIGPVSRLD